MSAKALGQSGVEKAVGLLRELYASYGFTHYKMSKFEEYDLYVKNKDFLVSDNVITFTDTDGKLMALKPDVTLSIIKNGSYDAGVEKLFYNETVYRVSKGTKSFKEFMQVGLECLGDIDEYQITEVLYLAVKSLSTVSKEYLLDISHLGVVKGVLEDFNLSIDAQKKIISYLGDKNAQGVENVCESENLSDEQKKILLAIVNVYGAPDFVIDSLKKAGLNGQALSALNQLESIVNGLKAFGVCDKVRVDFSVVNDMGYYNGIVFKGFISGIPTGILSGGGYDKLMQKMGKKARAIGFAVYLDELEKYLLEENEFDVDVAIEYGDEDAKTVGALVKEIASSGQTVGAFKVVPKKLRYKKLIDLKEGC